MGRTPCCDKEGMKKGPWTPEEDQKLIDYINTHGYRNWRTLPKNAGLQRCGKSCRLRWTNYLRPDIKRGRFSFEEEEIIIHLHSILGNKWSAIASRLPGRTDNEIKNYWNTHIRKRLLRMGIDPVTHSPRLDLLDLSSILQNPSLYNTNLAGLTGLQQLVNPDIVKLATSLISMQSQQVLNQIPTHSQQSFDTTQLQQLQTPLENIPQQTCTNSNDPTPCMLPFSSSFEEQYSLGASNGFDPLSNNMVNLGFDSQGLSELMNAWESSTATTTTTDTTNENHHDLSNLNVIQQNGYFAPYNGIYESENSTFQSDKQNFSFNSMLSTQSSSPTPLNSNSNSMVVAAEDERESYCSNLMKFEIPTDTILDVNEFM